MPAWESSNKAVFLQRCQLDTRAVRVLEQPIKLRMDIEGRRSHRWPDFVVIYEGRGEIHEVKPDDALKEPSFLEEVRAIARYVDSQNWRFSLTTEGELKAEPSCSNVRALWRQCARPVDPQLALDMIRIAGVAALTITDLIGAVGYSVEDDAPDRREVRYVEVLALLARGRLYHDRDQPLSVEAVVWTGDSGPHPGRLLPFRSPLDDEE